MAQSTDGFPQPLMYTELAPWFPLLTKPEEYGEEARFYRELLVAAAGPVETVLELGSGGGNNASHMKLRFRLTLVDLSPEMLAISKRLNPECEHLIGDMRSLRLGRIFDAVFIHDAIDYMTSLDDLRLAAATAFVHCRPGGAALFAPDFVRETFRSASDHGGYDASDRGLRYLAWTDDPDPDDSKYRITFVYLFRQPDGRLESRVDHHECGLFRRSEWITVLTDAGFIARSVPFHHSEMDYPMDVFVGIRRAQETTWR
jgi:SAM-dependent methyltransferase